MSRRTDARNGESHSQSSNSTSRRNVLRSGAAGAAVIGGIALAGCSGDDGGNGDNGNGGNGDNGNGGGGEDVSVAIVSSSAGFDDQAFNDNAREGLARAEEDFGVSVTEVQQTNPSEYPSVQANLAESGEHDLIVLVGFEHYEGLNQNAEEYPDQYWMIINDHTGQDNVSGWVEMNNQMSFLAGVAAATLTQEDISNAGSSTDPSGSTVGFVGGQDINLINAFEESYLQGVAHIDSNIEVLTGYGGDFSDTSATNNQATSQIESGADIVWHAAAAAGAGVFQAAQDNGRFALGVDSDQSVTAEEYSDVILGSAVKYLNDATYQTTEAVVNDNWEEVSGEQNLSVEFGGIDFVVGQAFEGSLPDSLSQNLEDAKQAIIDGEIDFECGPTGC